MRAVAHRAAPPDPAPYATAEAVFASKIPSFYHIDPIERGSFSGPAVSHERVGTYPRFGLVF